ncbi:MAG: AmmeMemoRadiSam system protein B [Treponema sp.]|nr:AmmeMemoRadiSam system protein B [Treponema sp.]
MQIRDYSLPEGWFPHDSGSVSAFLSKYEPPDRKKAHCKFYRAAIAPHAGWYYSGRLAALAVSNLWPEAETIVILGGHLPAGNPPLFAMEDAVKTPFGYLKINKNLRSSLIKELNGAEDKYRDNTIEVLLPMVHYFFPKADIIWLRLPAAMESFTSGKIISRLALQSGRKINVLASTDLTHYGLNYRFSPMGIGEAGLNWMKNVNDAGFINAVKSGNTREVLRFAEEEHAACSAGAVLGAMGFAEEEKAGKPALLEYGTSADLEERGIPDSFVGYAAFVF